MPTRNTPPHSPANKRWIVGITLGTAAILLFFLLALSLTRRPPNPNGATPDGIAGGANPADRSADPAGSGPRPGEPALRASPSPPVIREPLQTIPIQCPLPPPSANPDSFAESGSRVITALCADAAGTLWLGTEGAGLYRFNPRAAEGDQWTRFSTGTGLGDDFVYALACDLQGRVWAGHAGHGVSVYNGEKWQTYELVPGLSRPDSRAGPLGERIFHITVNPANGDVWLCTNAGLARYSPAADAWSYFSEASGLPSNFANTVVFDSGGNLYMATQANGIAVASPADGYKSWRSITAESTNPELKTYHPGVPVPSTPTGDGLPADFINDLAFARDGTLYAATTEGVAWSADQGNTWKFNRGIDWANKINTRLGGPSTDWVPLPGAQLLEDYCSAIAEDPWGRIIVGHRSGSAQALAPRLAGTLADGADFTDVVRLLATPAGIFAGCHGRGATFYGTSLLEALPAAPVAASAFPASAQPPTRELLAELLDATPARPAAAGSVTYLGQDWMTQGDWFGRYGRSYAVLCAASSPLDHEFGLAEGVQILPSLGANDLQDANRSWLGALKTEDPRSLWDPNAGFRRQGTWVDDGQAHDMDVDGPDLCVQVNITQPGPYRISLYFVNPDGHRTNNRMRDYLLDVKPYNADKVAMYARPSAFHTRVEDFFGGTYHQFLVIGPANECFVIHRNFSKNAHISGVFVDKLADLSPRDANTRAMIGNTVYRPPQAPEITNASPALQGALELWQRLGGFPAPIAGIAGDRATGLLAYRAAAAEQAGDALLELWRWQLPIWSASDRDVCQKTELDAWWALLKMNPQLLQRGTQGIRYPDGMVPPAPAARRGAAASPPGSGARGRAITLSPASSRPADLP